MLRLFVLFVIFSLSLFEVEAGRGGDSLFDRNQRNIDRRAYANDRMDNSPSMSRSGRNYDR